jgi:hypothetical protein
MVRVGVGRWGPKVSADPLASVSQAVRTEHMESFLRLNLKTAVASARSRWTETGTGHWDGSGERESANDSEQHETPTLDRFQLLRD